MHHVLRWLLVVPLAVAGVYAGMLLGIALHSVATSLCPPELLVSGVCTAWWFQYAEHVCESIGVGVGAALCVALPSLAAPRFRKRVAVVACAGGMVFASYAFSVIGFSALLPFLVAGAAGASSLWFVRARLRPEP